mmetsp:Transcript_541/g.1693  ORF Transcript_541/g.1693 Transcript_541/m.1693 type:complete len:369 (+) Transcript_541:1011-2117(+)
MSIARASPARSFASLNIFRAVTADFSASVEALFATCTCACTSIASASPDLSPSSLNRASASLSGFMASRAPRTCTVSSASSSSVPASSSLQPAALNASRWECFARSASCILLFSMCISKRSDWQLVTARTSRSPCNAAIAWDSAVPASSKRFAAMWTSAESCSARPTTFLSSPFSARERWTISVASGSSRSARCRLTKRCMAPSCRCTSPLSLASSSSSLACSMACSIWSSCNRTWTSKSTASLILRLSPSSRARLTAFSTASTASEKRLPCMYVLTATWCDSISPTVSPACWEIDTAASAAWMARSISSRAATRMTAISRCAAASVRLQPAVCARLPARSASEYASSNSCLPCNTLLISNVASASSR